MIFFLDSLVPGESAQRELTLRSARLSHQGGIATFSRVYVHDRWYAWSTSEFRAQCHHSGCGIDLLIREGRIRQLHEAPVVCVYYPLEITLRQLHREGSRDPE